MDQVQSFDNIGKSESKYKRINKKMEVNKNLLNTESSKNLLRSRKTQSSDYRPKPPRISHEGIVFTNPQGLISDQMKTGLVENKDDAGVPNELGVAIEVDSDAEKHRYLKSDLFIVKLKDRNIGDNQRHLSPENVSISANDVMNLNVIRTSQTDNGRNSVDSNLKHRINLE